MRKQEAVGDAPLAYCNRLSSLTNITLELPRLITTGKSISRDDLLQLCQNDHVDSLVCYAAVMAWGGRGVDSRNFRISLEGQSLHNLKKALDALRKSKSNRQQDFADFQTAALGIRGLGISFYTKLLFFLRKHRRGDRQAYILDQFTAKSATLLFPDCCIDLTNGGYPDPDTKPEDYEWFCAALERLGKELDTQNPRTGEQMEMALFDERGGDWRKHIRSYFPSRKSSKRALHSSASQPSPSLECSRRLAETISAEHIKSYAGGMELPTPKASVTAGAKVNCGKRDGIEWQYVVIGNEVRAAIFLFSNQRERYDGLRDFLGVTGHDFGGEIRGSGFKKGKTCNLSKKIPLGSAAHQDEWPKIAKLAVAAMSELFVTVAEII